MRGTRGDRGVGGSARFPRRGRRWALVAASSAAAVLLLALVLRFTDRAQVAATIAQTEPAWLGASIGCFLAYQWFRMRRTALLLAMPPSGRLFATLCLQGGANDLVLPAGTGDAALVYLLKRLHGAGYAQGLASLVAARVADLGLFTLLFAALALGSSGALPPMLRAIMASLAALLVATGVGLWSVGRMGRWGASAPARSRRARLAAALERISAELREVHARRIYPPLLLQSTAMWIAMYLSYVALLRALDAPLSDWQVLLLYVLVFPVDLSPVKGAANFGTHEGVWFVALRVLGVEAGAAAALSVATHLLILAKLLASVAIGAVWLAAAPVRVSR